MAEPQCRSLAQHSLGGLSCHMPVSEPTAAGLQMERRVGVALVLEKAGVACGGRPGADLGTVNAILIPWCGMQSSWDLNPACLCAFESCVLCWEPCSLSLVLPTYLATETLGVEESCGKKLRVTAVPF